MSNKLFNFDSPIIAAALGKLNTQELKKLKDWATARPYFANMTAGEQQAMLIGLTTSIIGALSVKVANNKKLQAALATVLEEVVLAKDKKFRSPNPPTNTTDWGLPDLQTFVFLPPDKPGTGSEGSPKPFLFLPPDNTVKPQQVSFCPSCGQPLQTTPRR